MNEELKEQLSEILRSVENDLGTTGLSNLCLQVLSISASNFYGRDVDSFFDNFRELLHLLKNTNPKIGIVISHFCEIWDEMQSRRSTFNSLEDVRRTLREITDLLINENERDAQKIIEIGIDTIKDGDSILIHSHSKLVLRVLDAAKRAKRRFRIILAEQEEEKTNDMIHFLNTHEIPFYTIPEYMLSHIEGEVSKVFLGGLTMNKEYNFVTDAGTNSVVSEFHHAKTPIYMFLATRKFSLWESTTKQHTYKISQKKRESHGEAITYDRIKFSHDRIPHDLMDFIITEQGKFTPSEIQKIYEEKYSALADLRKRHF